MDLLVKRLTNTAILPYRATSGASCFDVHADQDNVIPSGGHAVIGTGIAVAVPQGYEVQLRSRSGHASSRGIFVLNSPATIDSDYRGEIKVILANFGKLPFEIRSGDRVAQLGVYPVIMCPIIEVNDLDRTARGRGGLGHTGT
jgi:dUTP pyrophosphatase